MEINDSSFFPCGIVEGFYGPPWSHIDRLYMIKFLSEFGFNTYMYAPKDDEYHRADWRKNYPEHLSKKLEELVTACNLQSIRFVFTVSPGLDVIYSDRNELGLLIKKLSHVIEFGCSWIGILLDDINQTLSDERDKKNFGSLAEAHAYLVNSAKDELAKQNSSLRVTFCPTYYANDYLGKKAAENEYLIDIGKNLDKKVDILWTGEHVVSTTITKEDALKFGSVVRRKPLLWDNYPVNDYFRGNEPPRLRLNMGPFRGRSADLVDSIAGFLSNPMNESEASKLPLLTLADYLENPRSYRPDLSFENAMYTLYSKGDDYAWLREVFAASKASALDWYEVQDFRERVADLISIFSKKSESWKVLADGIRALLENYRSAGTALSSMRNKKLATEIRPLTAKLEKLGILGLECLNFMDDISNGSSQDITRRRLIEAAAELSKDKTQVLGQVDFGWMLEERKEAVLKDSVDEGFVEEMMSGLGLPRVGSESPVVTLYKYLVSEYQLN